MSKVSKPKRCLDEFIMVEKGGMVHLTKVKRVKSKKKPKAPVFRPSYEVETFYELMSRTDACYYPEQFETAEKAEKFRTTFCKPEKHAVYKVTRIQERITT